MKSVISILMLSLPLVACSTTSPTATSQSDSFQSARKIEEQQDQTDSSNKSRIQNQIQSIDNQLTAIDSQLTNLRNDSSLELATNPTMQSPKYHGIQAQMAHLEGQKSALNAQKMSLQSELSLY